MDTKIFIDYNMLPTTTMCMNKISGHENCTDPYNHFDKVILMQGEGGHFEICNVIFLVLNILFNRQDE